MPSLVRLSRVMSTIHGVAAWSQLPDPRFEVVEDGMWQRPVM
jgi:hypothetical protein